MMMIGISCSYPFYLSFPSFLWTKGGWCDSGGLAARVDGNGTVCENTISDPCFWNHFMGNTDSGIAKL